MLPPAQARAADNPDDIPDGIPRALAQSRAARVSGLHYQLSYTLIPHAPATVASETLRFTLTDPGPPSPNPSSSISATAPVSSLTLNGAAIPTTIDHGHLVLPAGHLHAGPNTLEAHFTANIGAAGKAITRFEDHDDGSEYLYTLFVPMDASMAFPCFDQPDLKARFTLSITAPAAWSVISNTPSTRQSALAFSDTATTAFAETEPLPTYLFAFAAGPFVNVHPTAGLPNVWVRKSKAPTAIAEVPAVQTTAADGIKFLSDYFAQPFPFPKYEMVLIPGFAYGGMEHAGCTFLREESVLFRTAPTDLNRFGRQTLVLHELTHQWFGDFTTMRWFDDLWLKEGFAQYMAYKTLAALHPDLPVWQRFYQSIKPGAYAIDETQGTTPIYQDIPNLNAAKSAYGAIVYSKAPGVLRQLNYVIGDEAFRHGLQLYLAAHQYGNATWNDLIDSFNKHPAATSPPGPTSGSATAACLASMPPSPAPARNSHRCASRRRPSSPAQTRVQTQRMTSGPSPPKSSSPIPTAPPAPSAPIWATAPSPSTPTSSTRLCPVLPGSSPTTTTTPTGSSPSTPNPAKP